jgi:hypothetical protein
MAVAPNPELSALLASLPSLDRGELFGLAAAHHGASVAREAAWAAVRAVVTHHGMERDLDDVRSEVAAWATHLGTITGQEAGAGMTELLMTDARRESATAVLDAAVALLLGVRLGEAHRRVLLGPWQRVHAA